LSAIDTTGTHRKGTALTLLVGTFIVGMLAGGAIDRMLLMHQRRMLPRHGMRFAAEHVLSRLDRELQLSEPQEHQIRKILRRREQSIQRLWSNVQPNVRSEIDQANVEIERVLTPEQRPRYKVIVERWRRRARGFVGPPPRS